MFLVGVLRAEVMVESLFFDCAEAAEVTLPGFVVSMGHHMLSHSARSSCWSGVITLFAPRRYQTNYLKLVFTVKPIFQQNHVCIG